MTKEEAMPYIERMLESFKYKNAEFWTPEIKALELAIEVLQGDMYCPNCGVRLVTEDEYLEPTQKFERKE